MLFFLYEDQCVEHDRGVVLDRDGSDVKGESSRVSSACQTINNIH